MNLELVTKKVVDLSRTIAIFLKEESEKLKVADVEEKGVHNLVTYVDKESERRIIQELSNIIPEAGFIAEEDDTLQKAGRYNWIIDPLDGTTNFIHGVPIYCVSIALMEYDEVISGVIMEVNQNECFYTWRGSSSFLNGKKIQVSESCDLDSSLLATGFPYYDYSLLDPYLALFKEMMNCTRGVRRLGSAAADLAYLACGRVDLFYEYGLQPWDVAAGVIIVKNAGGKITDFNGSQNYIFGKQVVASNNQIHHSFMKKLKSCFGNNVTV